MFDAGTAPTELLQPDPTDRALPPCVGKFLALLHTLIAYGRNLTDTLRRHPGDPRILPCFAYVARTFVTGDLTLILARITRGLLRAAALEERLRRLAACGQDLRDPSRAPSPPKPRKKRARKKPPARLHDPARDPSLDAPLTLEQIAAEDRRRPIGAVLVDICLDLGIAQGQMDRVTWKELYFLIISYGGNTGTLFLSPIRRLRNFDPAAFRDLPSPVDDNGHPVVVYPEWPAPPSQCKALASTGPP